MSGSVGKAVLKACSLGLCDGSAPFTIILPERVVPVVWAEFVFWTVFSAAFSAAFSFGSFGTDIMPEQAAREREAVKKKTFRNFFTISFYLLRFWNNNFA